MRVELPGGYAELRERVSARQRDALESNLFEYMKVVKAKFPGMRRYEEIKNLDSADIPVELIEVNNRFNYDAVCLLTISLVLDGVELAPVSEDTLLDLDSEVVDTLALAAGPLAQRLAKRLAVTAGSAMDPETGRPDPESPTWPSSASEPGGEDPTTPTTSPTPRPFDGIEPSATNGHSPSDDGTTTTPTTSSGASPS